VPTILSVVPLVQCIVCLSVVCDVLYCGKTVRLAKNCVERIRNLSQKVDFLVRRHISTSSFASTATEVAVIALFLLV